MIKKFENINFVTKFTKIKTIVCKNFCLLCMITENSFKLKKIENYVRRLIK